MAGGLHAGGKCTLPIMSEYSQVALLILCKCSWHGRPADFPKECNMARGGRIATDFICPEPYKAMPTEVQPKYIRKIVVN